MPLNIVLNEHSLCGVASNVPQAEAVIMEIAKIVASVQKVYPRGHKKTLVIPDVGSINMLGVGGTHTVRDCLNRLRRSHVSPGDRDKIKFAATLFANSETGLPNSKHSYKCTTAAGIASKVWGCGYVYEWGGILISYPSNDWSASYVTVQRYEKWWVGVRVQEKCTGEKDVEHASKDVHVDGHSSWIEGHLKKP